MSRLPIRIRLTTAFALAMLLMLASAALFVYLRLRADLDERIDVTLDARAAALAGSQRGSTLVGVALEDPEETFAQLLSSTGTVLDSVGTLRGPAITPDEARRAMSAPLRLERELPGVDGRARLRAHPVDLGNEKIVVVGQSLVDRNDALANVISSFAVGGVGTTLLASSAGFLLSTRALAPVEQMRRRAQEVSLLHGDERLPLPVADDEIRRLGQTLNAMLVRLRGAFEREGQFVADASHELRTPIAIIKTELEGALPAAGPNAAVQASLVVAIEECDRLAQLTEDLLVVARAADRELPVRRETLPARMLLEHVRARFTDRAARRGRRIRVSVEPGLSVYADPVRVFQALGNLVENALRHGDGDIVLAARSRDGGTEIAVSDQGAGFPPDLAAQAFERFTRGDRARSREGAGLGLAIVRAIADAHGGSAAIAGAAPTTLRLWLPSPT